jgi:hypothetical protein
MGNRTKNRMRKRTCGWPLMKIYDCQLFARFHDICPDDICPETFAQRHLPIRHLPRKTFAQKDICPERHLPRRRLPRRHLPRRMFAQKDICPEGHLPRKTFAQIDICPDLYIYLKMLNIYFYILKIQETDKTMLHCKQCYIINEK